MILKQHFYRTLMRLRSWIGKEKNVKILQAIKKTDDQKRIQHST